MEYCYSNNGMSFRLVPNNYCAQAGEVLFQEVPNADQLGVVFPLFSKEAANQKIMSQILALEEQQTPRRMREATAGTDGGWLVNINSQILTLRAQLQS